MVIFCADGHFYHFFTKSAKVHIFSTTYSHSLQDVLVDISIKGLIFDR